MNTLTDYHAKLFAHELLRRPPSNCVERFTTAFMDSQVDLNPHQVDAALFAFRSPLSKGALLADEVGLGKTIEAGIVLSQKWAERKRKILIVLPSSLRKQWNQELLEKFYLPSRIIETASFNQAQKKGQRNPFECDEIILCSYQFARNKADYIRELTWDLVVIDEAHRLRNVYKTSNKIARELKRALSESPKLLLTATPLQNSLLELYGLVSFIDDHTFGDLKSFKTQFARLTTEDNFDDLKQRLQLVCKRTLRRQVLEYIKYTERKAHTQEFVPTQDEDALYEMVSDYLRRPTLQALPNSQRSLMVLVLRKLLASSTFAIAGALESLAKKLENRLQNNRAEDPFEEMHRDMDSLCDYKEEMEINDDVSPESLTEMERNLVLAEIDDLKAFFQLAMQITHNAKGEALLQGLKVGFQMAKENKAAPKAIVFTESRRTQDYLVKLLSANGYGDELVLFNGSNNDTESRRIYLAWKKQHEGTDKVSGSQSADTRAALVDHFRDKAKIMIATEAAAEGVNLQFCSLVVNYDLPWNPQRIEQRIGRCHRYGQKSDVVVVNFLNKKNAADQRVYQLLSEKFRLFSGVFGASDEVLGAIESGVDFEKRIMEIYQTCRLPIEIQDSFDRLQAELGDEINETLRGARQKLLENFDTEVAEKLSVYKAEALASLNRYEALLWDLTRHVLRDAADFDECALSFRLRMPPMTANAPIGLYVLKRNDDLGRHYRLHLPLAQYVLSRACETKLPPVELVFDYTHSEKNIAILDDLIGRRGMLTVYRFSVMALEGEDHILCCGIMDDGQAIDDDQVRRLFNLPAQVDKLSQFDFCFLPLQTRMQRQKQRVLDEISRRNATFFEEEMDKLNRWAEDKRKGLKGDLKEYDDEIATLKKEVRLAPNLPDKLTLQKKIRDIDKKRDQAWKEYDEAARQIERQKDVLLDTVEGRLKQTVEEEILFTICWRLI